MTRLTSPSGMSDAENVHETQDTQAILDALKAELGVGGRRSEDLPGSLDDADARTSAGGRVFLRSTLQAAGGSAAAGRVLKKQNTSSLDAGANSLVKNNHLSAAQKVKANDAVIAQSSPTASIDPAPEGGASQQKNMDNSQQSPTQLNIDRDYGVYGNNVESSPPFFDTLVGGIEAEPLALMDDDTGAVNFGDLSPGARQSSQVSLDAGFENTRSEWRSPRPASQHASNNGRDPLEAQDPQPETPVLPRNPFGTRQNGAIPFAGSQLFKQTQLPTSAVKISPTSSRPSPNVPFESMLSHMMETSPLRNRANISSPTVVPTSSPQSLHDPVPSSVTKEKSAPPSNKDASGSARMSRKGLAHSSPTVKLLRSSQTRQPLAHYEPMKRSQERKAADETLRTNLIYDSDSDDDALLMLERRRRIERKRVQAAREMEKVSFLRPAQRDSEDPPSRKRRRTNSGARGSDFHQRGAIYAKETEQNEKKDDVSQAMPKAVASTAETAESTKATPGENIAQTCSNDGNVNERLDRETRPSKEMTDEEMIPATSPVRSLSAEVHRSARSVSDLEFRERSDQSGEEEIANPPPASDLPLTKRRSQRSYGKQSRTWRETPNFSSSIASGKTSSRPTKRGKNFSSEPSAMAPVAALNAGDTEQDGAKPSPSPDLPTKSVQPTNMLPRDGDQAPKSPVQYHVAGLAANSTSSQSSLTPVPSSNTTPETGLSPETDRQTSVSLPSPAAGRNGQRRVSRQLLRSGSPQPARAMRMGTRGIKYDMDSTDELQRSPSSSAPVLSVTTSKASRTLKQFIGPSHLSRGRRIFENMAFAISMQSSGDREQKRSALESKITQAGGTILPDGFQGLFDASAMSGGQRPAEQGDAVRLLHSSLDYGFTALIADQHSRKVKYMQALALGLPCLAYQWITTCLNKGEVVEWEPYLLAAGSSAALGDAVRSRCLQPYPAMGAKLVEVIERRPRLLAGQSLLVVVDPKRARSETKKEYIFLAQALGPSVHRVATAKEAYEALDARVRANDPFDWIYIDEATGTIESVLSGGEPVGRKRKRFSAIPIGHDIRILKDELVIQSLISGRMIGEDEMSF